MLLTLGYVGIASLLLAALSLSPLALLGFPVLITLWTAYLWVFTARSIRTFSIAPRTPARVIGIITVCLVIALAALVVSVAIGLFIAAARTSTS
ncbi:MAG TPA: hypothetical protein VKH34_16890 [Vicinamibacterales bacterium]|nr:hypothetical protein [Vicinamibacterales bacterium]